jgi:glycosyltransferase involved in cell wall biosynthesis
MNLTIIGPVYPYRGGIAHFTTLLAKKLQEQGHHIQIISFRRQYPKLFYPGKSDKDYSEGRLKVKAEYTLNPFNPISWAKTISNITKFYPDKVLIQWWTPFWALAFGFLSRRLRKIGFNVQYIIHNALPHEIKKFDKRLSMFALQGSNKYIVMSENEKEVLLKMAISSHEIVYCPLPLFSVFPITDMEKPEARKVFGLPLDKTMLLFFGIIRPYKGLVNLVDALGILKAQGYRDLVLVISGEFWTDKKKYLKEIDDLILHEQVKIFDKYISDEETSILFKAVDIFVAPYKTGTQSATIKTAMYFGLPMVITNCMADELSRAIPDYCLITDDNSPEKLAEAIRLMVERLSILERPLNSVVDESWKKMVSTLVNNR